jgi:hypothetical protein
LDIFDTIEVRWFLDDARAAAAARASFGSLPPEPPREDRYLVTGRDDLGFKARLVAGKPTLVETKYLLESLGPTELRAGVAGVVERWRKLSIELADPELERDGAWVRVVKSRRQRKLAYEDGVVRPIAADARCSVGCSVELTELEWDRRGARGSGLTLALEAFGPEAAARDALLAAAREAFAAAPDVALGTSASKSYPQWLATLP